MKGNKEIISGLNALLADELTVVNQYMVQSEMCANWGYSKLHTAFRQWGIDEMHHAEWLIERIIFLEGSPTVSKLNAMMVGHSVVEMISNDDKTELEVVRSYSNAIKLAREVEDEGSVELLTKILTMEENHVDWAEMQLAQIKQMGLENYLAVQSEGPAN